MDKEPPTKRMKKSDKAKKTQDLHGKYSQKAVREKERLMEARASKKSANK